MGAPPPPPATTATKLINHFHPCPPRRRINQQIWFSNRRARDRKSAGSDGSQAPNSSNNNTNDSHSPASSAAGTVTPSPASAPTVAPQSALALAAAARFEQHCAPIDYQQQQAQQANGYQHQQSHQRLGGTLGQLAQMNAQAAAYQQAASLASAGPGPLDQTGDQLVAAAWHHGHGQQQPLSQQALHQFHQQRPQHLHHHQPAGQYYHPAAAAGAHQHQQHLY